MNSTKERALIEQLRNAILLEADYHNLHAEILDVCAKGGLAPSVVKRRLVVSAVASRQRAKVLNEVLAASELKAEAS